MVFRQEMKTGMIRCSEIKECTYLLRHKNSNNVECFTDDPSYSSSAFYCESEWYELTRLCVIKVAIALHASSCISL